MRIEKIDDNRIRITLNTDDLNKNNVDLHSLLSNSTESQELFLNLLNEAEKSVGFAPGDCNLLIEAFAVAGGNFIFTITKVLQNGIAERLRCRKPVINRRSINTDSNIVIFKFSSFEDFCAFSNVAISVDIKDYVAENSLYKYRNSYYLVIKKWEASSDNSDNFINFYLLACEYGEFVQDAELFERKLLEYGSSVIYGNAIATCNKHFNNV